MWQRGCCWNRPKGATSPLSRGQLKSKGHGKLLMHFAADLETIETFSHSLYGAIVEICEECEHFFERRDPLSWGNQVPHSC